VTAEHKVNRFGSRYIYYHCSKRALGPRCRERSIELHDLEAQIAAFLRTLAIPPSIAKWVHKELQNASRSKQEIIDAQRTSLDRTIKEIGSQLDELTGLRLRGLISDEEFVGRRSKLQEERLRLQGRLSVDSANEEWFEPFCEVISFSNRAADWFAVGDATTKRKIFETTCSNPALSGKILSVEAAKPFSVAAQYASRPSRRGVIEEVRTQTPQEEWDRIATNIKALQAHFEPESVVKKPVRRCREWIV
jgi:hypothetical protein